jgi:leucyl/phenylalanyl-tRNA--protein transferase
MTESTNILRRVLKASALVIVRFLIQPFNPAILGNRTELLVRRLGFFQAPKPEEIIANYLRGYILFGRPSVRGAWFHWYRVSVRGVITSDSAVIPRRLVPILRRGDFEFRYDQDVEAILRQCQEGREGWLTPEVVNIYLDMFKSGWVATVGAYKDRKLVGGFWGLSLGRVFAIMSMFHLEKNAGALAVAALTEIVAQEGRWSVIDCATGGFWERFGAQALTVDQFSAFMTNAVLGPSPALQTGLPPKPALQMAPTSTQSMKRAIGDRSHAVQAESIDPTGQHHSIAQES